MNKFDIEAAKKEMTPWYWWGISTFFKCPWDEDPNNCDIALVGVPHSSGNGSTERDQHLAPRAIRNVSGWYRRAHQKFQFSPWEACRIHDLGDVPLPQAMVNDICVEHIEAYFKTLDKAGTRPVSIGGDHSITGPILKAIAGKNGALSSGRKAALLHFDAHRDSYEHMPHWLGSVRSAAHWAAYLIREEHVDAHKSVQIGLRGNPLKPRPLKEQYDNFGYRTITNDEFEELGVEETIKIIRERVGDAPLYITFDLDALDPTEAPAVANLEPGYAGMRTASAIKVIQGMRGLDVIGSDIVCMIPSKDNPANTTAMNSMVLMFEMLSLIADYLTTARTQRS